MRYLARDQRRNATAAEKALWERLRGRRLQGLKFLRQHPIGPFIADFCCRDRRLIVEVDGGIHSTEQQSARDAERDAYLRGQNYIVLRFSNEEVLTDLHSVILQIARAACEDLPTWSRS